MFGDLSAMSCVNGEPPRHTHQGTLMPINDIAQAHLDALINRLPFPGGIAFRKELDDANLNFTMQSLGRVDTLLDGVRTRLHPSFDDFLERNDNQNFLHAL